MLVLSQYVEQIYARELLAGGAGGIGYLLKDRVLDGAQFAEAVRRVADGGTAMDPEVIARLVAALRRRQPAGARRPGVPRRVIQSAGRIARPAMAGLIGRLPRNLPAPALRTGVFL